MIEILERGDVRFFWKPSVQPAELPPDAEIESGVQSFFLVLSRGDTHRRMRVGKKRMPVHGERLWSRIERVGSLEDVIAGQVEGERYLTKTRGERYQPGAELIAQGCYAFVQHDDHCHLVYRVEHYEPGIPEPVRVAEAGSCIVLFERISPGRGTWTTVGSPTMLDVRGAECVLVGADNEESELGVIDVLAA